VPEQRADSGDCRLLRPERLVRRPFPLNVRESERGLFAGEVERLLPAARLRELTTVRVSADGLLFKGLRVLPESFAFPRMKDQLQSRTRAKLLALNFAIQKRRRFEKRGVWITDTWSTGYFHWLTDALSRLSMVPGLAAESVLLLPYPCRALEYVHASLQAFRIGAVEFIGADEVLVCRRLMFPEHAAPSGHFDEAIIRGIRTTLVNRYRGPSTPSKPVRLFVSRALARKRRIVNESAVRDAMRARGFRIIQAEQMSFRDQVSLCATSGVLVSNHGAGLTNMLFMPEGAKVLELRHEDDALNNCYFALAAAIGLQYFFQGCRAVDRTEDPHTADVEVDIVRLNENLDLLMSP
jgi:hypothetical protein